MSDTRPEDDHCGATRNRPAASSEVQVAFGGPHRRHPHRCRDRSKEHGAFTELTFVQDLDPSTDEGRAHREGRKWTLTNLEAFLKEQNMTADDALAVVRAYHRSWTSEQFEGAIRLLAQNLTIEVPIDDYPTTESFANALVEFGGMVKSVALLAEFGKDHEAMLLYDLDGR